MLARLRFRRRGRLGTVSSVAKHCGSDMAGEWRWSTEQPPQEDAQHCFGPLGGRYALDAGK
jgi:hypothetical protein